MQNFAFSQSWIEILVLELPNALRRSHNRDAEWKPRSDFAMRFPQKAGYSSRSTGRQFYGFCGTLPK